MPIEKKWHHSAIDLVWQYSETEDRPSIAGLAQMLGVSRQTIYNWCQESDPFRMAVERLHHMRAYRKWSKETDMEPAE